MTAALSRTISQVREALVSLGDVSIADQFDCALRMLETPGLEVVVFGAFNRGKSTLINGLLGECVLPAKLVPTTGHVTRVTYGEAREVRILLRDGTQESYSLDGLDRFSLCVGGRVRDDIESIVVRCPSAILKRGLMLVDTPGIQDSEAQTRRAQQAVDRAHLILMVLDAQQPLAQWEQAQARRFVETLGKPLLLIVNKLNLIDPSERLEAIRRIDSWARRHIPIESTELGRSYLVVDALAGLKHCLSIGPKTTDDFASLCGLFSDFNPAQVQNLRSRGNCGYIKSAIARLRTTNDRLLWQLREATVDLGRRRAGRLEMLTGLSREFKSMAEAAEESVMLFARQRLSESEESRARTINGSAISHSEESFEEALAVVEGEACRRAAELECGIQVDPMPFTVAEELALQLRTESAGASDRPGTTMLATRDPVIVSRLRIQALNLLRSQFRARTTVSAQELDREMRELRLSPTPDAGEIRLRQSLETALQKLELETRLAGRTAQVARRAYEFSRADSKRSVEENWALAEAEFEQRDDSPSE